MIHLTSSPFPAALSRRDFLAGAAALVAACREGQLAASSPAAPAAPPAVAAPPAAPLVAPEPPPASDAPTMLARAHPRTGEALPAIGLGTWQTFDVAEGEREPLRAVLRAFAAAGGRVIDTSPMYGRAEEVSGDLVAETGSPARPFWATKVWTRGRVEGEAQIERSLRLLRATPLDLLQVHNLLDFDVHIETLRRLKDEGRVRYVGASHYTLDSFPALERAIRRERLDFVQLPYSAGLREAERRLLPAAADHGVAVLVMRPFEGGELLARIKGRPLPPWAAELGCTSFAQLFLKFILGHPAVNCPLPATAKPEHIADNLRAAFGRVADADARERIAALVA